MRANVTSRVAAGSSVHLRSIHHPNEEDAFMRKITVTLAAALFVLGSMAIANAQTQGASSLNAQAQNATIIHKAACGGWGRWCPPGRHRVCGPMRCWCAPCW
jgi:preprotein translocase subunit SecG